MSEILLIVTSIMRSLYTTELIAAISIG